MNNQILNKYIKRNFTKMVLVLSLGLIAQNSMARHGEHDVPGREDDFGGKIECINKINGEVLIQHTPTAEISESQFSNSVMELTLKARGHNITEMILKDARSGDLLKAKRLEELLKVTLITNEAPDTPVISESHPHQGHGEVTLTTTSGDKATVVSHNRRGVNSMILQLTTNESPSEMINIQCQRVR